MACAGGDGRRARLALRFSRVAAGLYEHALAFAQRFTLPSVYDALYAVLAQRGGVELWTADQRLLSALGAGAPWVHAPATDPVP